MNADQLKQLESRLWSAADQLRANSKLTATEYSFPVLGLIFLRHAYRRYVDAKAIIDANLPVHPQRGRRAITKADFEQAKAIYLTETSQWAYLVALPESNDIGEALNQAMKDIEDSYPVLQGVLPRDYSLFEKKLLIEILRIFNTPVLDQVQGDVFGRIYEYFLNKFAMSGAQEGGEFFTPPSLVNTIVNIIAPDHGIVLDPACGSAGMFVQTGHFIESAGENPASKVTFYGQEKTDTNTRLAKMNMAVHGLDASILQGNTFYTDEHKLIGKCDFVMANPPFNVDGVDKVSDAVAKDKRLPWGVPKNDNANYLWIQYFYSYLNDHGRAGFVMASSASDAGHSERLIRQQLVETRAVDVMVAIGPKFFYTRSLPCTLWFFDRAKAADAARRERTLMLDLREVYRKVSSNLHDFTDEQLRNVQAIVELYRGNGETYEFVALDYLQAVEAADADAVKLEEAWRRGWDAIHEGLQATKGLPDAHKQSLPPLLGKGKVKPLAGMWRQVCPGAVSKLALADYKTLLKSPKHDFAAALKAAKKEVQHVRKAYEEALRNAIADPGFEPTVAWKREQQAALRAMTEPHDALIAALDRALYFYKEFTWLLSRFPDGVYVDVPGLCKVVTAADIAANDHSLTAGRYVGVAPTLDEDFDYEARMADIKAELAGLNAEAAELAARIMENLTEIGI